MITQSAKKLHGQMSSWNKGTNKLHCNLFYLYVIYFISTLLGPNGYRLFKANAIFPKRFIIIVSKINAILTLHAEYVNTCGNSEFSWLLKCPKMSCNIFNNLVIINTKLSEGNEYQKRIRQNAQCPYEGFDASFKVSKTKSPMRWTSIWGLSY